MDNAGNVWRTSELVRLWMLSSTHMGGFTKGVGDMSTVIVSRACSSDRIPNQVLPARSSALNSVATTMCIHVPFSSSAEAGVHTAVARFLVAMQMATPCKGERYSGELDRVWRHTAVQLYRNGVLVTRHDRHAVACDNGYALSSFVYNSARRITRSSV